MPASETSVEHAGLTCNAAATVNASCRRTFNGVDAVVEKLDERRRDKSRRHGHNDCCCGARYSIIV